MTVSLILLEIHGQKDLAGDVTVEGFVGHMAIESFEWSVRAETVETARAAPKTTVKTQMLSLRKQFDSASTALCQLMEGDKSFNATLRCVDPSTRGKGGSAGQATFDSVLEIELVDCHIESIALRADDSGTAVSMSEDIELSFEKSITFNYRSYDPAQQIRNRAVTARIDTAAKASAGK